MKKFTTLLLALLLMFSFVTTAFAATDKANDCANDLYDLGLFKGTGTDENGKPIFELERAPLRNEAITMLVRLLGKEDEAKAGKWNTPFTDMEDWEKPYVGYAYANGLTAGTSETTYGGKETVTASQYLTFVLRALGYNDRAGDFLWDKAWLLSDAIGLTDGSYDEKTTDFVRGDLAEISHSALAVEMKGSDTILFESLKKSGAVASDAVLPQDKEDIHTPPPAGEDEDCPYPFKDNALHEYLRSHDPESISDAGYFMDYSYHDRYIADIFYDYVETHYEIVNVVEYTSAKHYAHNGTRVTCMDDETYGKGIFVTTFSSEGMYERCYYTRFRTDVSI